MGDAEVDQARFLAAVDHFDGVAQRGFGRHQERQRRAQLAHGVGRQRTHAIGRNIADALAEAGQTFQRALPRLGRQTALAIQPIGHAHRLAQAVHHSQLTEQVARDDHVEAVGTQVDGGQQVAVLQGGGGWGGLGHGGMVLAGVSEEE